MNEDASPLASGEEEGNPLDRLLEQYGELLSRHGPHSPEAQDFYRQHREDPEFQDLADTLVEVVERKQERAAESMQPVPSTVSGWKALQVAVVPLLLIAAVAYVTNASQSHVSQATGELNRRLASIEERDEQSREGLRKRVAEQNEQIALLTHSLNVIRTAIADPYDTSGMLVSQVNSNRFVPAGGIGDPMDDAGKRTFVWQEEEIPGRFVPNGWMPNGNGIAQDTHSSDNPHSGSHCIEIRCQLSATPWCGITFLQGGTWSPAQKFNLFDELNAKMGDTIKCRFWARSDDKAIAQFRVGGVSQGAVQDSLLFPVSTPWIQLTPEWKMYEIDLTGKDVSCLVGGFAWVCDRQHNGAKDISFHLDDIYFTKPQQSSDAATAARILEAYQANTLLADTSSIFQTCSMKGS